MKEYSGRTGISKWLYKNEDWWLPSVLILFTFFTPVIMMYVVYWFLNV